MLNVKCYRSWKSIKTYWKWLYFTHYTFKIHDIYVFLSKRPPDPVAWSSVIKEIQRCSPSEVFFGKMVLKICSKFTGEHPCRGVISIELQSNFTEITLPHGCSPVNLLHISEHLWRAVSATLHLSLFDLQKLANRMKFPIILI